MLLQCAGEFGERYGTGSGSDLAPSEVVTYKAPGRYRSLYRTNSPAISLGTTLQRLPPYQGFVFLLIIGAYVFALLYLVLTHRRYLQRPPIEFAHVYRVEVCDLQFPSPLNLLAAQRLQPRRVRRGVGLDQIVR